MAPAGNPTNLRQNFENPCETRPFPLSAIEGAGLKLS